MGNSSHFKFCFEVNSITIMWFGNWILPIRNTKICLVQGFRKHGSENWPRSPLMHRRIPTGSRSRASLLTIQQCAKHIWFKTNIAKRHKYWHILKFFFMIMNQIKFSFVELKNLPPTTYTFVWALSSPALFFAIHVNTPSSFKDVSYKCNRFPFWTMLLFCISLYNV